MEYLIVRNWDRWQSYRTDRGQPPWIKLHRTLLVNWEFVSLTDVEKAHLVLIWLLAAEHNGRVPSDPSVIQRLCNLQSEPNLEKLLELQFLERPKKRRRQHDVSATPLRRQHDAPETETEEETETEQIPPPTPPLPKWLSAECWQRWCRHRTEIRKPLRPSQVEAQWRKLDKLRAEGHRPEDVIDHSIAGGWQGLFPPDTRRTATNGRGGYETPHDRIQRLNGGADAARHDAGSGGARHGETLDADEFDLRR